MNLNWEPWFIIGRSNDAKTRLAVKEESAFHRDMIIFDSIKEDYYTISAKVEAYFSGLQAWGGNNNHPQYFMKADDDSVVEIPMLMEALKHLPAQKLYMVVQEKIPKLSGQVVSAPRRSTPINGP